MLGAGGPAVSVWGRDWDGLDPYSRPVSTTDYHGSGDVDGDGSLAPMDLAVLRQMADGKRRPNIRADLDGNGTVDSEDLRLLELALAGEVLPGWWDRLTSMAARREWVLRMLALDPGNQHPYSVAWQQCVGYSTQLFLRFASYQGDLSATDFGAGQTVYNLPMYCVSLSAPGIAHAVNAILVGDDPLRFEDWLVIEPQTDRVLVAGSGSLPDGATVTIYVPGQIQATGQSRLPRVTFSIQASGVELLDYDPALLRSRPPYHTGIINNHPNLWEPLFLPIGSGWLVVERAREDLVRTPDLHWVEDWTAEVSHPRRLINDTHASRWLATAPARKGVFPVLWRGKPGYVPSLMHGLFDPARRTFLNRSVVAEDRSVFSGQMAVVGNQTHVVWLELKLNASHPHDSGLYWCMDEGQGWTPPQRVVEVGQDVSTWHNQELPDARRYFFDLAGREDELVLVWAGRPSPFGAVTINERSYRQGWEEPRIIASVPLPTVGVSLAADRAGDVHLAYWTGPSQQVQDEGRGPLLHRVRSAGEWSGERVIDGAGDALCPHLTLKPDGTVGVIYDKRAGGHSRPAWSEWINQAWSPPLMLPARGGFRMRYPSAVALDNGLVLVSWAERSPTLAGFGCQYLQPTSGTPAQVVPFLFLQETTTRQLSWTSVPGLRYALQRSAPSPGSPWTALASDLLADDLVSAVVDFYRPELGTQLYRIQVQ